jgi:hypothetical protein
MAYENIQVNYKNFCIAPTAGHFASVDDVNDLLVLKNSSGDLIHNYSLNTGVSEIKSIEYPGPRGLGLSQSQLGTDLPFFTLEHNSSTQCTIREWRLDATGSTLDLENTIIKNSSGSYYFDCYDMAVEYYHTDFDTPTATGIGKIQLSSYSNLEIGDRVLLGPSGDVTNQFATEWAEITSISGGWAYIDSLTSPGTTPPLYEYASSDDVSFVKYIYLFSNIGYGNDISKGCLYKLNPYDGTIIEYYNSAIYHNNNQPSDFSAAAWSLDYDAIGFVKGSNLLYVDPNNNYEISKSQALTNINSDEATLLPIYDVVFDDNNIYRLQDKITLLDNDGNKVTSSWATYNYHRDSIVPYTLSLDITADPDGVLMNLDTITLKVVVRDNFGVGLSAKTVYFYVSGDATGYFTPINAQATTDSNGAAQIIYTTDGSMAGADTEIAVITAKTDGGSTDLGIAGYSGWIWGNLDLILNHKFTAEIISGDIIQKPTLISSDPFTPSTVDDELKSITLLRQWEDVECGVHLNQLSKFQFPGGAWVGSSAPASAVKIIKQLEHFSSDVIAEQIESTFENELPVKQIKEESDAFQLSQTYVSRHLTSGHKDDVTINQFKFIEDAIPPFWSEKNSIDTNIWVRLRPYGFDLNQSSLVFKVKEISYAGDTGYIDVTSLCTVTTFDAGGGLIGLDILYDPATSFHHNGVIYVYIEVYDTAPTPNIIITEYWFKIIADYKAPYITNESPAREAEDVSRDATISFDVVDTGVGVDISTLEFYLNDRWKVPTITTISGGYHVSYTPTASPYYGETAEVGVKVKDASDFQNTLYDMWRFYYVGSTGPWIDRDSFYPGSCREGVSRKQTDISVNVYGIDDTSVDRQSIIVFIGGKERNVKIRPIIYRVN